MSKKSKSSFEILSEEGKKQIALINIPEKTVQTESDYWLHFENEHHGFKIKIYVRKCDGFFGFNNKWSVERNTDSFRVPDFDTFQEVKDWIDEGGPETVVLKDVSVSSMDLLQRASEYFNQKKNITVKEKAVLEAISNQFKIRDELGGVEPDSLGFYPNGYPGMPVALEDRKAYYFDGTVARRTPKGQLTVTELIKRGDFIRSSYCETPYIVLRVSMHHSLGLPEYSLSLLELDHPRTKDGGVKGDSSSGINDLVAQDGRILRLFESSEDEIFKISKEEALDLFIKNGHDIKTITSLDLPKEEIQWPKDTQLTFSF